MNRKGIIILILTAFVISLSGCATARKQREQEMQGLRNQISVLEAQVQSKEEEIGGLRDSLSRIEQEKETARAEVAAKKKVIAETKARPKAKQIQLALRNAGMYTGSIDGKMGRQTKEAIKAFQRASNLPVDGKVGKNTWSKLREYLYKKIK